MRVKVGPVTLGFETIPDDYTQGYIAVGRWDLALVKWVNRDRA